MDSNTEDRVGTLIKVNQFCRDRAAVLAVNPNIELERVILEADTERVFQNDSIATRPLGGATTLKANSRKDLEDIMKLCRAGGIGYFTLNSDPLKLRVLQMTDTDIERARDSDIYIKADQVHDILDPVKALMGPFQVTAANVDSIPTRMAAYKNVLQLPATEEAVSEAAGKERDRVVVKCFDVTLVKIDAYMLPFKYTNAILHDEFLSNRSIDSSGGGSDSAGYTLLNFALAPGASASFGPVVAADKQIYIRQIGGTVGAIICEAAAAPDACASGFVLTPNTTVKKPYGDLGLSGGAVINMTNPGGSTVTVRMGLKN
jgi:hypothetical protein